MITIYMMSAVNGNGQTVRTAFRTVTEAMAYAKDYHKRGWHAVVEPIWFSDSRAPLPEYDGV